MIELGLLFLVLLPTSLVGGWLVLSTTKIQRIELVIPMGFLVGSASLIFWENVMLHVWSNGFGMAVGYFVSIFINWFVANKTTVKVRTQTNQQFLFRWILSWLIWGGLVIWKASHALVGGDLGIYYSIASSIQRGNYLPVTPWQPDVMLAYHIGVLELFSFLQYVTDFNWLGIHLWISGLVIIMTIQIFFWVWDELFDWWSYIWINFVIGVMFISFGFLNIAWIREWVFPVWQGLSSFVSWSRELPSAYYVFDTYGSVTNLDALLYVPFHAFGLALFICIVVFEVYRKRNLVDWVIMAELLSVLALVNEALFMGGFFAVILSAVIPALWYYRKSIFDSWVNLSWLGLWIVLCVVYICLQGGYITVSLVTERAVWILPNVDIAGFNYWSYHINAQITRLFPDRLTWRPFTWLHIGVDLLIFGNLYNWWLSRHQNTKNWLLIRILGFAGFTSLIFYNIVIPKYVSVNGNRMLVFGYWLLAISLLMGVGILLFKIKRFYRWIILLLMVIFVYMPTIIPPLMAMSKTRFGENKLVLSKQVLPEWMVWIDKNIPFLERIVVLDVNSPHPSGSVDLMESVGVLSPVFTGGFRTYGIEPGPELTDVVYTLSPKAIRLLGIRWLVVDRYYYRSLPEVRKLQLENTSFFSQRFKTYGENGRTIYFINDNYLESGGELPGRINEIGGIIPRGTKIYIDIESNFDPDYLRRPIIFSLRDREVYYQPGSGVYQHTETKVNFNQPKPGDRYDYLILGRWTNPGSICACKSEKIWTSVTGMINVWKVH